MNTRIVYETNLIEESRNCAASSDALERSIARLIKCRIIAISLLPIANRMSASTVRTPSPRSLSGSSFK